MIDLVISTGEKGGVGKSLTITTVVEQSLRRGKRVFIVEGDPSIPDVQRRYEGVLGGVQVSLQRPESAGEALVELFNAIEEVSTRIDVVAVNLPAGSAATVDIVARELIAPTLQCLDARLTTLYVVGPGEESVRCFRQSLSVGLCSIADACIAVPNEFFGAPHRFDWSRSDLRREFGQAGHAEFLMPKMIPRISDRVRQIPGSLYEMAAGRLGGLTIAERAGLGAWLRATAALGDLIFGVDDEKSS